MSGYKFKEWRGANCEGQTYSSCNLVLGSPDEKYSDEVITANFVKSSDDSSGGCTSKDCSGGTVEPPPPPIEYPELRINPSIGGNVTISPPGNNCGNDCYAYNKGDSVTLIANPTSGYKFHSWSGCNSNGTQCTISMTGAQFVTANFAQIPKHSLTVIVTQGKGSGTVSFGSMKNCSDSCSETYEEGTSVALTANPSPGSTFSNWSVASCSGNQCQITMNGPKTVTATFENKRPKVEQKLPEYHAENQEIIPTLKWEGSDPEDNTLASYEVILGKEGETPIDITETCTSGSQGGKDGSSTEFTCTLSSPLELEYNQWYVWTVTATDAGGLTTTLERSFKTRHNGKPYKAEAPSPALGEEVDSTTDLEVSWKDLPLEQRDPEGETGETVTYDVYLWKTTDEQPNESTQPVCHGVSSPTVCTIQATQLDFGLFYNWRVDATDSYGNVAKGVPWSFKTLANNNPNELVNPSLVNGEVVIEPPFNEVDPALPIILSWEGGDDPDSGDTVTHTIELLGDCSAVTCEEGKEPAAKSCTIPANSVGTDISCFWQVEAKDNHGNVTMGGPWNFTTMGNQPPSTPTNLVITNGGNQVDPAVTEIDREQSVEFSWTASEDPEGDAVTYQVCYKKATEAKTQCYPKTSAASKISDQLDNGTDYEMFVVAEDSQGHKAVSETLTFKTKAAPVKFTFEAKSGYANTLLKWGFAGQIDPKIVKYRLLRVEGQDTDFSAATTVAEVDVPTLSDYDEDALEKATNYCYRIDALDNNGDTLYQSNTDCVIFGETVLALAPNGGLKGEIVDVPIPIPNAGKLTIGSGEIWLRYDGSVIAVKDVRNTPITQGYTVNHSILNEVDNIKVVIISFESIDPPEMMGEGSLVDISFEVIGEFGQSSPLELVPFVTGQGGTRIQDNNFEDIDLKLTDSQFGVKKAARRLVRDGNTGVEQRFYVGEAYVRGDVRGDGTIETVDARIARFIGIGKYVANPEQLIAGDVNLDNSVDSVDAMMITHRVLHGDWPGAPAYEVIKTRSLRRGTPIILSLEEVSGVSGSEMTTMLRISNLVKLSAMNLSIAFDTNVVEIVKVEKTGLAEDTQFLANSDNEAGVIQIGMDSQTPLNGDGDIAKITLRLVSGGSVRSTSLTIAQANLYDLFGRDFVISALQQTIAARHGEAIITDIPEEPVIEDRAVETPIEDVLPTPSTTTGLHSATCQLNDHSGNPIAGATVTMGDKTVITDEYGYCAVVGLTEGDYSVTVSQDGYIFLAMPCEVGDDNNCSLNFVNLNVGMAAPALCQIYAVNDKGVKDSQIFTVNLDDFSITVLGEYPKHDLEALDIDPITGIIYLASGDNAGQGKKGHLYVLDGETGELFPVGSTGFAEIEDLAFSSDGTLWAWAKGD